MSTPDVKYTIEATRDLHTNVHPDDALSVRRHLTREKIDASIANGTAVHLNLPPDTIILVPAGIYFALVSPQPCVPGYLVISVQTDEFGYVGPVT